MPKAATNGIEIEYEGFGREADPALLLIMGLGAQMIFWEDDFCRALAERGFRVLRFDNRDVGLSTHLHEAGVPDVGAAMVAAGMKQPIDSAYTLSDMANDAAGLLDALAIDSAHVVGASMGGMIAQTLAIEHSRRIRSLVSIMSTTGDPSLPPPRPEAMMALLTPPPTDPDGFVDAMVRSFRVIGSRALGIDEASLRSRFRLAAERGLDPAGVARQLVAILASGDRTDRLRSVRAPTIVIHGKDDPLVPIEAGIATAEAIPGAELVAIDGMGHDLPRPAWPEILGAIERAAAGADDRAWTARSS